MTWMLESAERPVLALDAMGVLYATGDDVVDLLIPFVSKYGNGASVDVIEREYLSASLGEIDATTFWKSVGVDPALEESYLSGHSLTAGAVELLETASQRFSRVCCLSNDVAQWSAKLRRSFDLEHAIDPWVVSADVGCRKPSAAIYWHLLDRLGVPAERILFVDDRPNNLDAARQIGIRTILFDPMDRTCRGAHRRIERLSDLLSLNF
jgi:HAD superfamily hydrolase (TIGR01509 family)